MTWHMTEWCWLINTGQWCESERKISLLPAAWGHPIPSSGQVRSASDYAKYFFLSNRKAKNSCVYFPLSMAIQLFCTFNFFYIRLNLKHTRGLFSGQEIPPQYLHLPMCWAECYNPLPLWWSSDPRIHFSDECWVSLTRANYDAMLDLINIRCWCPGCSAGSCYTSQHHILCVSPWSRQPTQLHCHKCILFYCLFQELINSPVNHKILGHSCCARNK